MHYFMNKNNNCHLKSQMQQFKTLNRLCRPPTLASQAAVVWSGVSTADSVKLSCTPVCNICMNH